MKKSNEQNMINGVAKMNDHIRYSSYQSAPSFIMVKALVDSDPKQRVQEAAHQLMLRNMAKEPEHAVTPKYAQKDSIYPPMLMSMASDNSLSQQQQQSMSSMQEIKVKWKEKARVAKITWDKLTRYELLKLNGHG